MSLDLIVKKQGTRGRKVTVEMDADKLESLAAKFGLLNPDFMASLDRAEKDHKTGKYRKIKSLRDLD